MAIMFYNYIINILSLELVQTRELWIDVLVYFAMALGFLILGYFLYKVYNDKRIKDLENEILMDKDRLERRISILERELQHKYTKEDELLVIINNLKQKLSKAKFDDDSTDWHFELYSHISTRKSADEEE